MDSGHTSEGVPDFPLYDTIMEQLAEMEASHTTMSMRTQNDVWAYTLNLPIVHAETVFVLILHYMVKHDDTKTSLDTLRRSILPYQARAFGGGKGLVFRLDDLPERLRHVIALFLKQIMV
jgi:hypothetical protein